MGNRPQANRSPHDSSVAEYPKNTPAIIFKGANIRNPAPEYFSGQKYPEYFPEYFRPVQPARSRRASSSLMTFAPPA
jgi:hypothetical protein